MTFNILNLLKKTNNIKNGYLVCHVKNVKIEERVCTPLMIGTKCRISIMAIDIKLLFIPTLLYLCTRIRISLKLSGVVLF